MHRKPIKQAKKTFCLPSQMKRQLAEYSKESGLSEAELLRQMIREFFQRQDWRNRVDTYYEHPKTERKL